MIEDSNEIVFLDSNILIYAFDVDHGMKHEIASDILEDLEKIQKCKLRDFKKE